MSFIHQAHRGAGFLEAENCVEALELGWSMGLATELDVSTTRDGMLIGFHDGDLKRMVRDLPAGLEGRKIREIDWSELRELEIDGPEGTRRIPTVAEILVRVKSDPKRRLYLDIKEVRFAPLADLVREHGVADQVIFASNHDEWIAAWRKLMPEGQTLRWVWMDEGEAGWARAVAAIETMRENGFKDLTQLQLHVLVGPAEKNFSLYPSGEVIRELAREMRGRGIVFQVFPHCGEVEVYRRLMKLGVDSFATDHPHELLAALTTSKG